MAVPSMLMVAPRGSTKEATSFLAPSFWVQSRLMGRVPTLEALEKAKMMAGIIPLKNLAGLMPPMALTDREYTRTAWKT